MPLLERVDPRSEMLLLSTFGNTKNILLTALEVRGPFDDEAGRSAVEMAAKEFPHLACRIKEVRVWGLCHLEWDTTQNLSLPVFSSDMSTDSPASSVLDRLMEHLSPRLDRQWNPFEEVPAEIHFVKADKDHYVLVSAFRHVAADAGTASEFGREFLAHYHEIKTGKRPEWANLAYSMSSSRKRPARLRDRSWKERMASGKLALAQVLGRAGSPAGSGSPCDLREFHVKRVLSEEETGLMTRLATTRGVSPVDLLTATSLMAIDQWNGARNIPRGLLSTAMTVNTRGRAGSQGDPNVSSVIFFKMQAHEREDLSALCRSLAMTRMHHFRKQMDLRYMADIEMMINSGRLFPYPIRRRIVNYVVNRHNFSIGITALGVLWPKVKNGKPTAETAFSHSADLEVTEVHGFGYKLLSNTGAILFIYAFRSKVNLVLVCSAALLAREEAEAFMDLILANLLDNRRTLLAGIENGG